MSNSTPSADDLACPFDRYTVEGENITVTMLRPYWQQHPNLFPRTLPGTPNVTLATWLDGTMAAVPADADGATLAAFYLGARIVAELAAP